MIAYCGDHGIAPVAAGGLLAVMGMFNLIGTTASGWLTDRYNPRHLLALYYGVRGLSLLMLPMLHFTAPALAVFALFYGLNWIATLPPRLRSPTRSLATQKAQSSTAGCRSRISLAQPAPRMAQASPARPPATMIPYSRPQGQLH